MGIEYVVNLGGPELDMYLKWLSVNENITPIQRGYEYMVFKDK